MGYLHDGHRALIRQARERADKVIVTIFVNPTQFGPGEDLARYPRDLPGDLEKCQQEGVALVFSPQPEQMYPPGYHTYVEVEHMSQGMCGARRPGHFRGVCTIVTKLFNLVGPCVAIFGQKDYQQFQIFRCMVRDLNQPIEVVGAPTIREADGLAMSSRNAYLTPEERRAACCLYQALHTIQERVQTQQILSAKDAIATAQAIIEAEPLARLDYIEIRDAETLDVVDEVGHQRVVIALAVFIGKTRLIDNVVI
jgi:pantoate--beta-alanine ligase